MDLARAVFQHRGPYDSAWPAGNHPPRSCLSTVAKLWWKSLEDFSVDLRSASDARVREMRDAADNELDRRGLLSPET